MTAPGSGRTRAQHKPRPGTGPSGDRRPPAPPGPSDASIRHGRLRLVAGLAVAVLVLGLAAYAWTGRDQDSTATPAADSGRNLAQVSGQGATGLPPWPVPAGAPARAAAAGLPMGPMGMAEHYHPQLAITVDGRPVELPTNLGVDPATGAMSAVHTHTPDGVIHIEAARDGEVFTLGQLFTEWDVKLAPDQLGDLQGGTLTVTVNDKPYLKSPALLRLADKQKVTLTYTTR